ncbi:MAG: glycosyltransferase family 4 protein [Gammaproteobacteria bacterium]|nr:glycosyltransferase family 4 protein [Gammaproteobacteria bacterium]
MQANPSENPTPRRADIAVVLKGYPRLSETFIAQELHALEQRGLRLLLVALRHPTDISRHPIHAEITAPAVYLPEYLHQEPLRVLRAWWQVRRNKGYRAAVRAWLRDLRRDLSRSRLRRFGQALVLAAELPDSVRWLYAHFLHTPASVTRYTATLTQLPWSCSAHAKDVWTSPQWDVAAKLQECQWLVTCTRANKAYLSELCSDPQRIKLVYHGLDFQRFADPGARCEIRDGSNANAPAVLLTVGRAVPKKGLDNLLRALAALPEDCHWRWHHVGGGSQLPALKQLAGELTLGDALQWHGALAQAQVLALYRQADVFVLPSRIAADGDRDGLPNVLMEAQSQRLACIATAVSGIPELIEDQVTGILVPPQDCDALQSALLRLITDPQQRKRLGNAGFTRVRERFSHQQGIDFLAECLPQ